MARVFASSKKIPVYRLNPRCFSNKLEHQHLTEEINQEIEDEDKTITPVIRYNVCRERSASTSQKYQFKKSPLAPAPQEEHSKTDTEKNITLSSLEPQLFENQTDIPSAGYRQFEASSTYKNLVLPLKASKLSDPFPSPVKMMPSHTVSDQEKADQMMAERRIPRSITKKKR